ncbi:membrane protein [Salmonella enterica subsp. enterica]|uniref:Membrane protein n=1 Tax=Salmonella enterica I TaxID=59201 RepID=A0A379WQC3_SALET|nr:membrane protein [Salmonella enterica subsp. enterica]
MAGKLAGMMLLGAALMRSGWLKGQYSLRHYRRTGALLVALGLMINLPAVILQWRLDWAYRWCAFLLQAPRELSAPLQTLGYAALMFGFWPQLSRCRLTLAIACVGRNGADQLSAADDHLYHTVLSVWLIYEIQSTGTLVLCRSGMGNKPSLLRHLATFLATGTGRVVMASTHVARVRIAQITIWITFINKMAVTVSIPVMFLTQPWAGC